jgi:hypothetical protein
MIRLHMRWPVVALLLLLLTASCAGRGERAERPPSEVEPEELVEEAPLLAPPAVRCDEDGDCRLTQVPRPIASVADCYCPECPHPFNARMAAEHEEAWERLCSGAWATARRCFPPMCPPLPGAQACVEGRCGFAPVP